MADRDRSARIAQTTALRLIVAVAGYSVLALIWRDGLNRAGRWPLWTVIIATALVTLLLALTDGPIRAFVDRLNFGDRAGGYQAMRELLVRMSDTLPVDEVVPRLAETAGRTTRSKRAEVRVWMPGGEDWSQVWPPNAGTSGDSRSVDSRSIDSLTVDVRHAGDELGEIEVALDQDPESRFDRQLLEELAGPAGLALSTVRLTYELRQRAAQLAALADALQESNQRLLGARRAEQERLQDEVTDRVTSHILSAVRTLKRTAEQPAHPALGGELSAAGADVTQALEALRLIARGIFPPTLADGGLSVALEGWPLRSGVPARMRLQGDGVVRDRPELEACLYFCVVTALAALADRGCSHLTADVEIDSESARFRVAGSTPAGVERADHIPISPSTVLAIRDRVEAFGGALTEVPADATAVLGAVLPVSSAVVPVDELVAGRERVS